MDPYFRGREKEKVALGRTFAGANRKLQTKKRWLSALFSKTFDYLIQNLYLCTGKEK